MSREHVTYIWGDGALNRLRGESTQCYDAGITDVRMLGIHFSSVHRWEPDGVVGMYDAHMFISS